jgi:hypothetical protein
MLQVHMSEKKHLFGVWIIIKLKKMFAYLEVVVAVVFIIMAVLFLNILTWNPYKKNKHPNINADYYELKKKPDDDGEEV